jgi:transcriptional regulator with XRE-family HTH domain
MNVGENIRIFRELRKYSQDYMAHKLTISQSCYAKLEKQEVKLSVERLLQIADILKVDASLLVSSNTEFSQKVFDSLSENGGVGNVFSAIPDYLLKPYQNQIQQLKEEVAFLRGLVGEK